MSSQLEFSAEDHSYRLRGEVIPGNTFLLEWDGWIDKTWFTPESRDRGTRVHTACWFQDEGDLDWDTVLLDERGYVEAFIRFKREMGWVSDVNEFRTWSEIGFATTPDLMGVMENYRLGPRRAVCNLKTGQISKWVDLQLAGEFLATRERIQAQDEEWTHRIEDLNGHPYPEHRFALQLFRDGRYKLYEAEDPSDEIVFAGIVQKYHWAQKNRIKRVERWTTE